LLYNINHARFSALEAGPFFIPKVLVTARLVPTEHGTAIAVRLGLPLWLRSAVWLTCAFAPLLVGVAVLTTSEPGAKPFSHVAAVSYQVASLGLGVILGQILLLNSVFRLRQSEKVDWLMQTALEAHRVQSPSEAGAPVARSSPDNSDYIPENWPEDRIDDVMQALAIAAGVLVLGVVPFAIATGVGTDEIAWGSWCSGIVVIAMTAALRSSFPEVDPWKRRLDKLLRAMFATLVAALFLTILVAPYL
jgi:hypothetical protein